MIENRTLAGYYNPRGAGGVPLIVLFVSGRVTRLLEGSIQSCPCEVRGTSLPKQSPPRITQLLIDR